MNENSKALCRSFRQEQIKALTRVTTIGDVKPLLSPGCPKGSRPFRPSRNKAWGIRDVCHIGIGVVEIHQLVLPLSPAKRSEWLAIALRANPLII